MKVKKKKIKSVLGHDEGLTGMVRKAPWLLAKEQGELGGNPNKESGRKQGKHVFHGRLKPPIDKETQLAIAKERAGGASDRYLAQKYGCSISYVKEALRTVFTTSAVGREILKNVILENGIACGMHARAGIKDLSTRDAIVATGIMSSKFVELDKHIQSKPAEVDFTELQSIGKNLQQITEQLGDLPSDEEKDFIDV